VQLFTHYGEIIVHICTNHINNSIIMPQNLKKVGEFSKKGKQLIKNNIDTLIFKKFPGLKRFIPTDDLLMELDIKKNRFAWIRSNMVQPTFEEAFRIACWLNVTVDELYDNSTAIQAKVKNAAKPALKNKLLSKHSK
jgi:transcriptional regulator with XRE-family HTH domain